MSIQEIIEAHGLINRSVSFLSSKIDEACKKCDLAEESSNYELMEEAEKEMAALIVKCKAEVKQLDIWEAKLKELKVL